MPKPLVSILVPVYNVEKYISKCCYSLFEQTYDNIEYIFVDDKSLDNSINILSEVAQQYPNRLGKIKYISHDINYGLAQARISGLNAATGEYIMFVDSDDYIDKRTVSVLLSSIVNENSDISVCNVCHISKSKKWIEKPIVFNDISEYISSILRRENIFNIWGKLYKRSLFNHSGVTFIKGLNFGEDYVVYSRIIYFAKKISYVNQPFYNYIHYNLSSYTNGLTEKSVKSLILAETIISEFYKDKGGDYSNSLSAGRLKIKSELLINYFRNCTNIDKLYLQISSLYLQDYKKYILSTMSVQDRLILKLCSNKNTFILKYFIRIGYSIKQILK